ncbi:MAG: S4 domain-containing protein [bacterium]
MFLVSSGIIKRRTLAKLLCDNGSIRVNNIKAKASKNVNQNDYITIEFRGKIKTFKVLIIPEKNNKLTQDEIIKLILEENATNEND